MSVLDRIETGFAAFRVEGFHSPAVLGSAEIRAMEVSQGGAMRAVFQRENLNAGDVVTSLLVNRYLVMSDTRDEYRDHVYAISQATGRVLIHGLGLGCYLKAILCKPDVTHVDVVEINADVLALVGGRFQDDRVTFHQADVFEHKWPVGTRWDCVWHDIWPDICTDDLATHAKLLRSFGRRCGWQGAWKHEELVYRNRGGW